MVGIIGEHLSTETFGLLFAACALVPAGYLKQNFGSHPAHPTLNVSYRLSHIVATLRQYQAIPRRTSLEATRHR